MDDMATRRKSTDITHAELISMVARLRGALYGVLAGEIDKDEIRSLLAQTAFDCDGDSFNAPEPTTYRIGANTVRVETAVLVRIEGDKDYSPSDLPLSPVDDGLVSAFHKFLVDMSNKKELAGSFRMVQSGNVLGPGKLVGAFIPESEGVIRQWVESRMSEEPSDGAPGSFPGEGK